MKNASYIIETAYGFKVMVCDHGFVPMVDLIDGEWKTVYFKTRKEAQKAFDDYNDAWKEA